MSVRLRLICINPPPMIYKGEAAVLGLQDKKGGLLRGTARPDGALVFDCALEVNRTAAADAPNFLGDYAHGTPKERFLYLSYGYRDAGKRQWIKRLKIPLADITWVQIETAARPGMLEATVDGSSGEATVPLIGGEWVVR